MREFQVRAKRWATLALLGARPSPCRQKARQPASVAMVYFHRFFAESSFKVHDYRVSSPRHGPAKDVPPQLLRTALHSLSLELPFCCR